MIDTGSEVTRISETFCENNIEGFMKCEMLPIEGTSIVGVTGVKPLELKHRIYKNLKMGNWDGAYVFLIIPELNTECNFGVDLLKRLKSKIDFEQNTTELKDKENTI